MQWAQVMTWKYAEIDLVAHFGENPRRLLTNTVTARPVRHGLDPKRLDNRCCHALQFLFLQPRRQILIERRAVLVGLEERRSFPGLEMGPDLAAAALMDGADRLIALRLRRDRIVHEVYRSHAEPVINVLDDMLPTQI